MKIFKVGDRVAVYDKDIIRRGEIISVGMLCEVLCGDCSWLFHPKQLRRLKPKPKSENKVAREFWVHPQYDKKTLTFEALANKPVHGDFYIHVTELPPGSAVVTREELAKAWDNSGTLPAFLKHLGLSPEGKGGKG